MDTYVRDVIYIYTLLCVWIIYFSSWIFLLSISFRKWKVLISIPVFYHRVKSHMDLKSDMTFNYYFEFQIWNLDLQSAYNTCKFTIWLWWCSNLIPYNSFWWTSSNLKSIHIKSTYSEHNVNLIPSGCVHFMIFLGGILFLFVNCQQEPIVVTAHIQKFRISGCVSHNSCSTFLPKRRHLKIL